MGVALIIPVMTNFFGFAKLMESIEIPVLPIVINNWDNNIGVGPAWNVGLKKAAGMGIEHAVVVNDDVVLRPGVIRTLINGLDDDVMTTSPINETGVCHPYGLNFWCFAVRPRVLLDKIGEFDEAFAPAYFEDDDMAYRIRLAGYQVKTLPVYAYHQVRGTESVVTQEMWNNNAGYYARKWGGLPNCETFTVPFNGEV